MLYGRRKDFSQLVRMKQIPMFPRADLIGYFERSRSVRLSKEWLQ